MHALGVRHMFELLRDGIWQFVGALIAVLSIVAAVVLYYLQKQRKEFAFGALSSRSLLTVSDELSGRVSVLFDQEPVTDIRLIVLGGKNSGDKPILATDFERPLSVGFGPQAKVLAASLTKQSPLNLGADVQTDRTRITLTPLLLNPGDYFVVQLLVASPKLAFDVDTRIVDVPTLAPLNTGLRLRPGAIKNLLFNAVMFIVLGFSNVRSPTIQ